MVVNIMIITGDLQFNMGSDPWWGLGIPHTHNGYALSEVREKFGMRKDAHLIWPGSNPWPSEWEASSLPLDYEV
jgi:hypothetical protein